ncbi:MAG: SRPBCC family protein [Planctomycetes bacterium]|nr:SRPBCC family protein [Planctomycetota bacterium]
MKGLLKFIVLLLIVAAAVGFFTSTDYTLERSIVIQAPPEAVHAYVGDLNKWPEWTPWEEADPTVKTTVVQATGVGAHQTWTSQKEGGGELTFTKSDPKTGIAYDMDFVMDENTKIPSTSSMTYKPAANGGTEVTWTMQGSSKGFVGPVVDGWMKILMPMMVGGDFDKGLTKLKEKVEAQKG